MRRGEQSSIKKHRSSLPPFALVTAFVGGLLVLPGSARAQNSTVAPSGASVTVVNVIRGTPRGAEPEYRFAIECRSADGTVLKPSGTEGFDGRFTLTRAQRRTFTATDFPGLVAAGTCVLSILDNGGAQSSYETTQPLRADGSRPDPRGGQVSGSSFVSSPALASGQTISAISTFTGDLTIVHRAEGSTPGVAPVEISVTCSEGSYARGVVLADGQQQTLTDLPAGASCDVRASGANAGRARYSDTSGAPTDGTVTIVASTAACWDLRNTSPECRPTVTVTTFGSTSFLDPTNSADTTVPTTTPNTAPETAPPATASPAAAPAPATATSAEVEFTG